jgi:hypothetical protein
MNRRSLPTAVSPLFCCDKLAVCGTSGKCATNRPESAPVRRHKVEKNVPTALSKDGPGWYIPPAPDGLGPGVAFQGSLRDGRSKPRAPRWPSIQRPRPFDEGAQRFNAGWSSPVARQAHNLKVIGSNPIPATKFGLHRFRYENGPLDAGHFCFWAGSCDGLFLEQISPVCRHRYNGRRREQPTLVAS